MGWPQCAGWPQPMGPAGWPQREAVAHGMAAAYGVTAMHRRRSGTATTAACARPPSKGRRPKRICCRTLQRAQTCACAIAHGIALRASGCVEEVHLDIEAKALDGLDAVVDADRRDVLLHEAPLAIALDERALPHGRGPRATEGGRLHGAPACGRPLDFEITALKAEARSGVRCISRPNSSALGRCWPHLAVFGQQRQSCLKLADASNSPESRYKEKCSSTCGATSRCVRRLMRRRVIWRGSTSALLRHILRNALSLILP